MLQPGDKAPDFSAADQNGITRSLKDYKGKKLVLYFYPKDMTSGCTRQACDFRDNMARIAGAGVELLGVSPDPVASHAKFVQKESLNFPLLSDESKSIVEAYGGHGIGRAMHMDPHVAHIARPQSGHRLREGMAFTVEPMINAGTATIRTDADGWTVRTADGALSAQFEHTLLIGRHGPEITTLLD